MDDQQRRNQERSIRVRALCLSLPEQFAATSPGGRALAALNSAITRAEELDAEQSTHRRAAKQGTSQRGEARTKLRTIVSAMARTTRTIETEHAEIRGKFRLPSKKMNDTDLLTLARSFRTEAPAFKPLFLEYGMPDDFLEALDAGIGNFEQGVEQQNTGSGQRTQARAGIDEIQDEANRQVAVLDTVIRNKYRDDPATLAAWESASRLERAPKKSKKQKGEGNITPASS